MTSHGQCPRGGGECPRGGCFSIFRRADDVTRTMPKGRVRLVFHPSKFRPPPPPGWLATSLRVSLSEAYDQSHWTSRGSQTAAVLVPINSPASIYHRRYLPWVSHKYLYGKTSNLYTSRVNRTSTIILLAVGLPACTSLTRELWVST